MIVHVRLGAASEPMQDKGTPGCRGLCVGWVMANSAGFGVAPRIPSHCMATVSVWIASSPWKGF